MDWKELLKSKIESGELPEPEDSTAALESTQKQEPVRDILHVSIDRKGRKGKTATIIEGFTCPDEELQRIASTLKQKLGLGGSARCGEILVQGDVADKVRKLLEQSGYKVK